MKPQQTFVISLLLLLCVGSLSAQTAKSDLLDTRLKSYSKKGFNDIKTYMATDKELYEIEETIWLSAIVVNRKSHKRLKEKLTLKVVLYDTNGETVLTTKLYCMEGMGKGSLGIPEGFSPGRYILSATAGSEKISAFQKEIIIKRSAAPLFIADVSFENKYYSKGEIIKPTVKLKGYHNEPIKSGFITFNLMNGDDMITSEKVKLGKNGVAMGEIKIPNNIASGVILRVEAKNKGITEFFNIPVPFNGDNIFFHCVPEGKTLVNGVPTSIYFRANDSRGNPFEFKGKIVNHEGTVISEVSGNSEGKGSFYYTPSSSDKLKLKIDQPFNGELPLNIPAIQDDGASLIIAGDEGQQLNLKVLSTKNVYREYHLAVIHQGIKTHFKVLDPAQGNSISLAKSVLQPGVNQITLFDESLNPLSEQLYFISNAKAKAVQIDKGQQQMELRGKSEVVISSSTALDYSFRVCDKSRLLAEAPAQNIVSYLYFDSEILDPTYINDFSDVSEVNDELKYCSSVNVWNRIVSEQNLDFNHFSKGWTTNFDNTPLIRSVINGFVHYFNYSYSEYYMALNPALQDEVMAKRKFTSGSSAYKEMLMNGTPVKEVLRSIKPYDVVNNMVVFYGSASSISGQDGALIIVDGINRGKIITLLDAIQPITVKSIRVGTSPQDIQRYTGFNTIGIIDITLKDGSESSTNEYVGEEEFEAPEYPKGPQNVKKASDLRTTIQWKPFRYKSNASEKVISYHSDVQAKVLGIVEGIDVNGVPFFDTFEYSTY
ncbi:MAG: hypothetical protein JXQ96_20905 [Cyclobacteriaceae bacterium]